ncbi:MAG: hypothetical protein ACXWNK_13730 [Vulcanimicrobiaceae bacterium]
MKRLCTWLLLFCTIVASSIHVAAAQSQMAGTWTIQPARDGYVHLSLRYMPDATQRATDDYSSDVALATLGLTPAQISGANHDASFSIARDAGTVAFAGTLGQGVGAGHFTFVPSAVYAAELAKRGIDAPGTHGQLAATMLDLRIDYVDAMASAGYPTKSFERLITFRALHITPGYARTLRSAFGDIDEERLVSLSALHVTPQYASDLRNAGVTGLDARMLVQMKALGVDAAYIKELADAGYPHLSANQLTQLRALHIDKTYINRLESHGMKNLSIEDLVRLKALNI